jgi:hypothetical protein
MNAGKKCEKGNECQRNSCENQVSQRKLDMRTYRNARRYEGEREEQWLMKPHTTLVVKRDQILNIRLR